jgi:hypothetical protein
MITQPTINRTKNEYIIATNLEFFKFGDTYCLILDRDSEVKDHRDRNSPSRVIYRIQKLVR